MTKKKGLSEEAKQILHRKKTMEENYVKGITGNSRRTVTRKVKR